MLLNKFSCVVVVYGVTFHQYKFNMWYVLLCRNFHAILPELREIADSYRKSVQFLECSRLCQGYLRCFTKLEGQMGRYAGRKVGR